MEREMTFLLLTPEGEQARLTCDSVRLPASDGGSVGVRPGHLPALIALGEGEAAVLSGGAAVRRFSLSGGMARVERDSVTVVTDRASPAASQEKARP